VASADRAVAGASSGSARAEAVGRIEAMNRVSWFRLPWGFILKRTLRSFSVDACTDLAAGLTYFAVLSLFPAMIALVSILGLVGQSKAGINALFGIVEQVAPGSLDAVKGPIVALASSPASGWALVIGVVGAIWSASGYVGGFGRDLNRVFGVPEGRPALSLRLTQLGVTIAALILIAIVAVLLVISGPVATAIGDILGVGESVQIFWSVVKWPVLIVALVLLVALLYYATPNVRQTKFRWLTTGSFTAIVLLGIASALFALYVGNFGNYDRTYGSLAGIIVFLLWLWITNVVLLLGAELDSEIERARELVSGIEADAEIKLPLKSTKGLAKAEDAAAADILAARAVRRRYRHG
jgi:membrane protein